MRFISLSIFIILYVSANAQDRWVFVCSSVDYTYDSYYDSQSIQYTDNEVIVWEKTINTRIKSTENPNNDSLYNRLMKTPVKDLTKDDWNYITEKQNGWLDYTLQKRKYYCGERKYELLFTKDVYMDGSSKSKEKLSIFTDAQPETIGEKFYLIFCNK